MNRMMQTIAVGLVCCLAVAKASAEAGSTTLDNFENDTANSAATGWSTYGAGSLGNMTATASPALDGKISGSLTVNTKAGTITTAKQLSGSVDYSSYTTAVVLSESVSAISPSTATLSLYLDAPSQAAPTDGTKDDHFVSKTAQVESSNGVTTYSFSLASTAFNETEGTDSITYTLQHLTNIGFRIAYNPAATSTANETLAFDDFTLQTTAAPEPASAILLGLAATPMLIERRRRRINHSKDERICD